MKRQMKKWLGIFAAAFLCFSPVSALAAETDTPLTITSGLDLECEEAECTFSEARIVYGEAEPDTWITFKVSVPDQNGEPEEIFSDEFSVGSLGLFSATLPLEMGYNYVTLTAELDGSDETAVEVTIKRVPQKVKKQLQRMIALPGMTAEP